MFRWGLFVQSTAKNDFVMCKTHELVLLPTYGPYIWTVSVFCIWDLYITTSIESIAAPGRLFSIFNISLRALDVLFIALSAILRDSIRQSYWNACIRSRIRSRARALFNWGGPKCMRLAIYSNFVYTVDY